MILRAPGMAVARADREAEPPVQIGRGVEIAHRMDDVIEAARHSVPFGATVATPSSPRKEG